MPAWGGGYRRRCSFQSLCYVTHPRNSPSHVSVYDATIGKTKIFETEANAFRSGPATARWIVALCLQPCTPPYLYTCTVFGSVTPSHHTWDLNMDRGGAFPSCCCLRATAYSSRMFRSLRIALVRGATYVMTCLIPDTQKYGATSDCMCT